MKLFLSHQLYGNRTRNHFDCYHQEPGWLFIELGSWTLEIEHPFHRRT